jgi:phosphoribosylglycinamide formyltransferase 1
LSAAPRPRVAVLISGRGSNMTALIQAARRTSYPAEIALVVSNRPDAGGLARAEAADVPTAVVDHTVYPGRAAFEDALDELLNWRQIELIALAGFMRVFTAAFVERWTGRMLNIHPSLLPLFRGTHTHERALAEGVLVHGCTVHFVVPELDAGPMVAQAAVPVLPGDTPDSLAARVLAAEHQLYPEALGRVCRGEARLAGGRAAFTGAWTGGGALLNPLPGAARG